MGKLAVQKYFSFMILIVTFVMMIFTFVGSCRKHSKVLASICTTSADNW